MMTQLLLKEKPEETHKKTVEGIMVCIECGSPNTTILTNSIYCRNCRSFKAFGKRKSAKTVSQKRRFMVK